ncbi:MAG TPA: DUF222 domain-containing protein [Polyangia bacterium]|jgi:hypothetical protein
MPALAIARPVDTLAALEDEIATLAAQLTAATARLLECIRQFDALEGWAQQGSRTCAHWLSWRTGLDLGAAREHVRVARALGELPRLAAAFGSGEISYSKIRAVTRIARPETEDDLLGIAREATAAQVERLVRAYRRADPAAENAGAMAQHEGRWLNVHWDERGMLVVEGRLPPEQGAIVLKALEAAEQEAWRAARDVPAGTPSAPQRRADALGRVAADALAHDGHDTHDHRQVLVHVDAEVLADPAADGRCALDHGPALAAETARRLACDATVIEMRHGDDHVAAGRKRRTISTRLRRALDARDGGCVFPGCTNRRCDGHHVEHWADGGATVLPNLASLCDQHHTLVHEGGFRMRALGAGRFELRRPDGTVIPPVPATPRSAEALPAATTPVAVWRGDRLDYDWAVSGLLGRVA